MAWWDTALTWADRGSKLLNAARPFINTGVSIYDRNQTQNAIGDAFGDYQNFANRSLNTLDQIYRSGEQATQPYRTSGTSALTSYQKLLSSPDSVRDDPGYKFRLNEGEETLRRTAAASGYRGSGNEMLDAIRYGQDYATKEYDNALSRYLPLIQTGQNATGQFIQAGQNYGNASAGINIGLGEAAAGSRIGQSGSNSRMVTDFLGLTGGKYNPFGSAADVITDGRSAANGINVLGELSNAGGGNPFSAIGESARNVGQNTWADPLSGPRTSPRMPTVNPTVDVAKGLGTYFGTGGTGALAFSPAVNAGGASAALAPTGMAPQWGSLPFSPVGNAVSTAGASTGTSAAGASAGWLAAPFVMLGGLKLLDSINWGKGGASNSAKLPKLSAQLKQDVQSDPSGRTAQATIDRLVTNKLWANENNGPVVASLIDSGTLSVNAPSLYSRDSIVNMFADKPAPVSKDRDGSVGVSPRERLALVEASKYPGDFAYAKSFGLSDQQAKAYVSDPSNPAVKALLTPQNRLKTAINMRNTILSQNPRADVTKLNEFIRSNS